MHWCTISVSYTHLDVYKRQELRKKRSQLTEVPNQKIDVDTQTRLRRLPNISTDSHQQNNGNKYIVERERKKTEERKADTTLIAVSYTHLDVYKRQVSLIVVWYSGKEEPGRNGVALFLRGE